MTRLGVCDEQFDDGTVTSLTIPTKATPCGESPTLRARDGARPDRRLGQQLGQRPDEGRSRERLPPLTSLPSWSSLIGVGPVSLIYVVFVWRVHII
jgi:hypothetical protein